MIEWTPELLAATIGAGIVHGLIIYKVVSSLANLITRGVSALIKMAKIKRFQKEFTKTYSGTVRCVGDLLTENEKNLNKIRKEGNNAIDELSL